MRRLFQNVLGVLVFTVLTVTILIVNVGLLLTVVIRPFSRDKALKVAEFLGSSWWALCHHLASLHGMKYLYSGDELPQEEEAIVVANHQTMADVLPLFALGIKQKRLSAMKYFAKEELKWVPGVGGGLVFMEMLLVSRNWERDAERVRRVFARQVQRKGQPFWLVIFPEGTRFTPAKLAQTKKYARQTGMDEPQHVLLPRPRGFAEAVCALRGVVPAVYDLTFRYPPGLATLWDALCGRLTRIEVHVRRFPIETLPDDRRALADWLRQVWREKERWLASRSTVS